MPNADAFGLVILQSALNAGAVGIVDGGSHAGILAARPGGGVRRRKGMRLSISLWRGYGYVLFARRRKKRRPEGRRSEAD
jgi:hypothetical protein